jgi:hypothetical protein
MQTLAKVGGFVVGLAAIVAAVVAVIAYVRPPVTSSQTPPTGSVPGTWETSANEEKERLEYIATVDGYCRDARAKFIQLGRAPTNDPTAYLSWLEGIAAAVRTLLNQWRDVPYPRSDEREMKELLGSLKAVDAHTQSSLYYARFAVSEAQSAEQYNQNVSRAEDEYRTASGEAVEVVNKANMYGMRDCKAIFNFN